MHKIKIPLLVWFLLYSFNTFSQTTITGELQKWHKIAITFNGPNSSENSSINPFLDYRLNVTFSSPTGKTFLVPGFYAADGNAAETSANSGNKWRVRFTPNEVGRWSYSASFRRGANVAINTGVNAGNATSFNGASGNFNISASTKSLPDNRARGRLNYIGERYLKFEETGKYFLKAGSDSPENLLAYNDFDNTVAKKTWGPHAQDWRNGDPKWKGNNGKELVGAINYLSQKGMNAFSFLTMSVIGDGKDVWPWAAQNNNNLDGNSGSDAENRLRYDVSKLAQWEILFSHADTKGMYLHFKTQETENDQLLDGGNLGTQRKLYYRELIARFGHHLALNWNLGEENDIYDELNDSQNTRVKAYANFFENLDPYNHHIVIHSYPESSAQNKLYQPLLGNGNKLTGASVQTHVNNVHNDIKKWVDASKNAGKKWVVANDEQGGARSGVTADSKYNGSKGSESDNRKDTRNKVLWGTLMAGGAGVEYYFGYDTGETDLSAQDFRSRDLKWNDAKIALDFFNKNLPFWEMESHDEITSNSSDYCLAKLDNIYAIYLPNGGSTSLNLLNVNGSFTIKWYNPVTGGSLVNGSVTQINGGGNRSIGSPPNNTSSDWVALVQSVENTSPSVDDNCSLNFDAVSDFPKLSVSSFSPAYVDNVRNALAINAVVYKDKFAAAETTFNGQTGTYNITLNTLLELDGESTYNIKINGVQIGTFTNPTTAVDYTSGGTTFEDIAISNGDTIRVEFNSATNGKISEGNGTAYSRGRWTSLNFECPTTSAPPSTDCTADAEEDNGLVVIEAESLNGASGWVNSTAVNGFTGDGYIDWQGADSFGTPGKGKITAKIKINTPGTYLFQWRSKVGEGTNTTESNDSWLRFPDADDFFGQKGSSKVYPKGSGKTPNPAGASSDGWFKVYLGGTTNWTWASSTSDNNAHKIYVKFNSAGTYTMEISGRSKHHLIDRIVLSKGVSNATNLALKETLCTGSTTIIIGVTSVEVSPSTASVKVGGSLNLTSEVFPANASNKNVMWSSSDTSIAGVDQNGKVVAFKKGDVLIKVTTEDGNFSSETKIMVLEETGVSISVRSIFVTPQQLTIEQGQTTELTYKIKPSNATNQNVSWRSTDASIATVDQYGVVTALKAGLVEIEALTEDGGRRSDATIKVTPSTKGGAIAVTGISVSPSSTKIVEGNSIILDYEIMPANATNKKLKWSSSDESIAVVSQSGIATALKIGEAVITVVTEDGGFEGKVTIKVIKKPEVGVPVRGIYVTPQFLNLAEGETAVLSYEIKPTNASNKNVIWSSKDTSIATVDKNGVVTALRTGTAEIEATTVDGQYWSDSTVKVVSNSNTTKKSIIAYPNPTRDEVRINGIQGEKGWVGVYGFNGKLIERLTVKRGQVAVVSLAKYPAGTYVIRVLDENKKATRTIIKL